MKKSFAHCHAITRKRARNFYYGLKLTPEPRRSALYAIYAFMRACDDLVDETDGAQVSVEHRLTCIARFREHTQQVIDAATEADLPEAPSHSDGGDIWPAVWHTLRSYPIQPAHLHEMLDGQQMDVTQHRYATFDDLYGYCYRVASVVGLVCLDVWGHDDDPGTHKLAEYRGIAFQLTNILRDLVEDAHRGRVYLPREDLDRFGVTLESLQRGEATAGFERMMTFQIERARSYYEISQTLERHITADCRATSWAMTSIYRSLLERIAQKPVAVLDRRVRLSPWRKLSIACRAVLRRKRMQGRARTPT